MNITEQFAVEQARAQFGAQWWVISVAGYGSFLFDGSEKEAEEMRAHKARWERGIGRKRLATPEEIKSGKVIRDDRDA